jgi:hypothetical protein
MVRSPVKAELWHNIESIRRAMLTSSFSYLPVEEKPGVWKLISDFSVVKYLDRFQTKDPDRRGKELGTLIKSGDIKPLDCRCFSESTPIADVWKEIDHQPVLITEPYEGGVRLVGILSAFDLL